MLEDISIPREEIADFCRRWHVRRLALFGSVLTDEFGPESDMDVLVQFEPGHVPGFEIVDMEEGLASIPGHKVDLEERHRTSAATSETRSQRTLR